MNVIGAYLTAQLDQFAAALYDAVRGMTGGSVDLRPWYWELQPPLPGQEPKTLTPSRFEAYTDCPKCGRLDWHWLRPARPKPERGPTYRIDTLVDAYRWDGMTSADESMHEVIRTCTKCNHEWGQI